MAQPTFITEDKTGSIIGNLKDASHSTMAGSEALQSGITSLAGSTGEFAQGIAEHVRGGQLQKIQQEAKGIIDNPNMDWKEKHEALQGMEEQVGSSHLDGFLGTRAEADSVRQNIAEGMSKNYTEGLSKSVVDEHSESLKQIPPDRFAERDKITKEKKEFVEKDGFLSAGKKKEVIAKLDRATDKQSLQDIAYAYENTASDEEKEAFRNRIHELDEDGKFANYKSTTPQERANVLRAMDKHDYSQEIGATKISSEQLEAAGRAVLDPESKELDAYPTTKRNYLLHRAHTNFQAYIKDGGGAEKLARENMAKQGKKIPPDGKVSLRNIIDYVSPLGKVKAGSIASNTLFEQDLSGDRVYRDDLAKPDARAADYLAFTNGASSKMIEQYEAMSSDPHAGLIIYNSDPKSSSKLFNIGAEQNNNVSDVEKVITSAVDKGEITKEHGDVLYKINDAYSSKGKTYIDPNQIKEYINDNTLKYGNLNYSTFNITPEKHEKKTSDYLPAWLGVTKKTSDATFLDMGVKDMIANSSPEDQVKFKAITENRPYTIYHKLVGDYGYLPHMQFEGADGLQQEVLLTMKREGDEFKISYHETPTNFLKRQSQQTDKEILKR